MRHLVIGQRQKAPDFSAFHWSPHGCLITIGQHFVTTRVVHLPERTETSLITESDESRANHQLLQLCLIRTAWSDSDQAERVVHSCKSRFCLILRPLQFKRKVVRLPVGFTFRYYKCTSLHNCPYIEEVTYKNALYYFNVITFNRTVSFLLNFITFKDTCLYIYIYIYIYYAVTYCRSFRKHSKSL